jgi:hypothetical protein
MAKVINNTTADDIFMACLRRLSSNEDFKVVLKRIEILGKYRKDLKSDDPIELARLAGSQYVPNFLNDRLDMIKKGDD